MTSCESFSKKKGFTVYIAIKEFADILSLFTPA